MPNPKLRLGAKKLAGIARATSFRAIAAALAARGLEVSRQAVAQWCTGDFVPSAAFRGALFFTHGIPELDWLSDGERRRVLQQARARVRG